MAENGDDILDMIEGHRRFRQTFEKDRAFYKLLATSPQKPRLLWIGCADSRVIPAMITGADPGELFVIRNIANIVPPADSGDDSVGAAIEYCVLHLGVDDIVVCGHTGCGGVKALSEPVSDPHLKRWIDFARPAAARGGDLAAQIRANVLLQREHLVTYPCVRDGFEKGAIKLHAWLFDMIEGSLLTHDDETGEWRVLLDQMPERRPRGWLSRLTGAR